MATPNLLHDSLLPVFSQSLSFTMKQEDYTLVYQQGSKLPPVTSPQTSRIVELLRICFPALQSDSLSDEEVLVDGIGFHDLNDTTWILFYGHHHHVQQFSSKSTAIQNELTMQSTLVGLITAIVYHNGLYLCNFCVSPEWRNQGLGLNILEQSGCLAYEHGLHTLIGNASTSDPFILKYYQSLGATVVDTGGGSSPEVASSVRLQRRIPQTTHGIHAFFQDLRRQRQNRRQRWRYGLMAAILTAAATAVTLCLLPRGSKTARSKTTLAPSAF